MNSKETGILLAAVGLWYYFIKTPSSMAAPGVYPAQPLNPNTGKPSTGGGGSSGGGSGSGGGGVPSSGSGGAVKPPTTTNPSAPVPGYPGDPCDPNGGSYDEDICYQYGGTPGNIESIPIDPYAPGYPGYVDSEDPCDPTSTAYDAYTCGMETEPTVDSGDPCDPNSSAFDITVCYGYGTD